MGGIRTELRRSQFIRTYGPGAIIETPQTPAVILSFNSGAGFEVNSYLINDPVLESYLASVINEYTDSSVAVKVFELPASNPDISQRSKLKAKNFQRWYLCTVHGYLWKNENRNSNCPECKENEKFRNSTPIRFIQACKNGHMDDIQWDKEVHSIYKDGEYIKRTQCGCTVFRWEGPGTGTAETVIKCVKCGRQIKLSDLYNRNLVCTGRYPEKEKARDNFQYIENCSEPATVILRMASNLRIPETVSVFMVWPRDIRLGIALAPVAEIILVHIESYKEGRLTKEELVEKCRRTIDEHKGILSESDYSLLSGLFARELKEDVLPDLERRLCQIKNIKLGTLSYRDILDMEYEYLKSGSKKGILETLPETGKKYLEVNHNRTLRKKDVTIVPIDILSVIEAQIAYRRIDIYGKAVPVSKVSGNTHYFPAIMISGEGIFIDFKKITLKKTRIYSSWIEAYRHRHEDYDQAFLFKIPKEKYEVHPVFVFLHTFSHLLIKALSLYSGYSSSSIRERIYVRNLDSESPSGGIVLYTATEDESGAMGGLVSLVEETRIKKVFNRVKDLAFSCSNDPVCKETLFKRGNYSGASCYSCTAISETSCDHRNLWLDRNLFLENLAIIEDWL